ncbi:hypothetical protein [Methylobacterium sp. CM6244]
MLKAAMGIIGLGLHTVLLNRSPVDDQTGGTPAQVRSDEAAKRIFRDVRCPWTAATLLKEGKQWIAELTPYASVRRFKDVYAAGASSGTFDEAWMADQQRVLRLLGKAANQADLISSGVRYITTNRKKVGEPRSPDRPSVMEKRLFGEPNRQKDWELTMPEMVEVALHGHVNPGRIWLSYDRSIPMFEAAICAGFCSMGMVGILEREGAEWLKSNLANHLFLVSENAEEFLDFLRCRDLIMNAFSGRAQAKREDLKALLIPQIVAGLAQPEAIHVRPIIRRSASS